MLRLGDRISLGAFLDTLNTRQVALPDDLRERLQSDRVVVDAAVAGEAPVYGLNTALGAKLGTRIPPGDIPAFQRRMIAARACAVGPARPAGTGHAMLLARLVSASAGGSGISPALYDHLVACFARGVDPQVPRWGSIGASDLTQNACWALRVLDAEGAPALQPKDGMALINHAALTVAACAQALGAAQRALGMVKHAALVSFTGYHANPAIFSEAVNGLRPAPGQAETAGWFRAELGGTDYPPTRVQDALSFRTLAPVIGAAEAAVARAVAVWEDEANGLPDSPAVVDGSLVSTPNFHAPALALAVAETTRSLGPVAVGAAQRFARLLNPILSGLPRDLAPDGGTAAGFVPLQKTAAALVSEVQAAAVVRAEAAPVSEGVEDMAPMTPLAADDLLRACAPLELLAGIEARAAVQAHHLRPLPTAGAGVQTVLGPLQARFGPRDGDTPLGPEVETAAEVLRGL